MAKKYVCMFWLVDIISKSQVFVHDRIINFQLGCCPMWEASVCSVVCAGQRSHCPTVEEGAWTQSWVQILQSCIRQKSWSHLSVRACSENTMFSLNPQSEWEACPLARRRGNPPLQNEQHKTGRWLGYGRHRVVEDGSYLVDLASSICLSQRLSHACLSTSLSKVKPRMAH